MTGCSGVASDSGDVQNFVAEIGKFYTGTVVNSRIVSSAFVRRECSESVRVQTDSLLSARPFETNLGVTSVSHVGTYEGGFGWYRLDD